MAIYTMRVKIGVYINSVALSGFAGLVLAAFAPVGAEIALVAGVTGALLLGLVFNTLNFETGEARSVSAPIGR